MFKFSWKTLSGIVAFAAGVVAIIIFMGSVDDRYAKAADVLQSQTAFVKSINLVNINLELLSLQNRKAELKRDKRNLTIQLHSNPNNIEFKLMLDDVKSDLVSVCRRIDELETKMITE